MFTGDRSGDWLYAALFRAGLANQPPIDRPRRRAASRRRLGDRRRPLRAARQQADDRRAGRCRPFLDRELALLPNARVIVALGSFGWDGGAARPAGGGDGSPPRPKPRFGHGAEAEVGRLTLIGSYHPSQQNTFTGTLTEAMLDAVLGRAKKLAGR